MKTFDRRWVLGALTWLALNPSALAQDAWPHKVVKIIVPFSAGTGLDVVARGFAERLAEQTKATVTVENREGAGGTIGAIAGARAPADGATLTFTAHAPFAVAPYMQSGATYDPLNDFVPISKIATIAMVLITGRDSAYRQFDDVAREAKASPGKLSYATTGIGTPSHLNVEAIKRDLGLDIVAIPYKNTGQAMSDVVGNQVPLYMPSFPAAIPMLKSGQVRGLAIGSTRRSALMPDIPTVAEVLKKPGVESGVWYGFLAPRGTPPEVVQRWHDEIARAAATPQVKEMFARVGADAVLVGPQEFRQQLQRDAEQARRLIEALNIRDPK